MPLSLQGHVLVSVKRDLGWRAKRLRAWRVPPDLSCEVTHVSANPGSPRPPVACLGRRQGRAGDGWLPGWRYVGSTSEAEPQEVPRGSRCLLRPYHPERAPSRLILEAKQGRAWLVLGWETTLEYRVLYAFLPPTINSPLVAHGRGRHHLRLAPLQASPPQAPPNTACSGGGAPRRSGWTCGQKAALVDNHKPAAPGVAGLHPDCTVGPADGR